MNMPTQTNGACKPWLVACSVQACAYRLQSNVTKKGTKPPDAEWKHKSGLENAVLKRLYKFSLSVVNIKRTVLHTCCCTQILLWPTLPMDDVIGERHTIQQHEWSVFAENGATSYIDSKPCWQMKKPMTKMTTDLFQGIGSTDAGPNCLAHMTVLPNRLPESVDTCVLIRRHPWQAWVHLQHTWQFPIDFLQGRAWHLVVCSRNDSLEIEKQHHSLQLGHQPAKSQFSQSWPIFPIMAYFPIVV